MRLNRPPDVAGNPEPAGGRRSGAGVVRTLSVAAVATAACSLSVLPAMASTAHTTKHATKTTVSAPKTGYTGTEIKLSATVKSSGGGTATGKVTFRLDGKKLLCRATLSKGKGSCDYKFVDPATKTITGRYMGNSTHSASRGSTKIVVTNKPTPPPSAIATTTTITNPPADVFVYANGGQTVTLTATVTSNTGDSVPTGTVTFTPDNLGGDNPPNLVCTATLADGDAACNVTPAVGTWGFVLYTATYTPTAGSDWTTSTTGTSNDPEHKLVTWDVTSTLLTFDPSPATEGDPVTLTADVTNEPLNALAEDGGGAEQVTFSIGGVAIPGCSDVAITDPSDGPDNIATCSYTPTTTGTVTIEASYLGDLYALPSSDTETLTVNP